MSDRRGHAKHRRRGIMIGIGKYPQSKSEKPKTLLGKLGVGVGWAVLGVVLVAIFIGALVLTFNPRVGARVAEADVVVDRMEDKATGYPPEAGFVAAAVVSLEDRWVRVPLREADVAKVAKGTRLHVRYDYAPRMRIVQIQDWSVVAPAEEPR